MSSEFSRRPAKGRILAGSLALVGGLVVTGGVWAAPAYATCSPGARPCIDNVFMDGPTTLVFTWTGVWEGHGSFAQVRYHDTAAPGILGLGGPIPEDQFKALGNRWDIMNVNPGATYVLKVQGCTESLDFIGSSSECTEWDEKSFTVPLPEAPPGHSLGRRPVQEEKAPPNLEKQIDLPDFAGPDPSAPTATVAADVDVYNAKNEPDGAGQVVGILRQGNTVSPTGSCAPESWCEVSGDTVPGGHGWVWGHLNLS